jgi:CRISPR-associated protein Cmr4
MIQGTGIKGKLRAAAHRAKVSPDTSWTTDDITAIFGPENNGSEHAGALITGDARILLFPVRSLSGVFAYTTSADVLNRFMRDSNRGRLSISWEVPVRGENEQHIALVPHPNRVTADKTIVLEEFSFDAKPLKQVTQIGTWLAQNAFPASKEYDYWRQKVQDSLVILPDNDFRDFVVNATEIITRVRINRETKTVEGGALWTEEHLPTDTLLYVPIYATNARKLKDGADNRKEPVMQAADILNKARTLGDSQQGYIQLGGDETVGRGMVRMHWR